MTCFPASADPNAAAASPPVAPLRPAVKPPPLCHLNHSCQCTLRSRLMTGLCVMRLRHTQTRSLSHTNVGHAHMRHMNINSKVPDKCGVSRIHTRPFRAIHGSATATAIRHLFRAAAVTKPFTVDLRAAQAGRMTVHENVNSRRSPLSVCAR